MSGGQIASLFQTRVFPACNLMPAPISNFSPRMLYRGRVRCGEDTTCTSSRNASKCSERSISRSASTNESWMARAEQEGHQRVPLFASFSLPHRVPPTSFVFPLTLRRLTVSCPNEWQQSSQTRHIVHCREHGASEDVVVRSNAIHGAQAASPSSLN